MPKEKILIIKAGYSEFLDKVNDSRRSSLGDVLRTTPILHLFKDDYVTWVTDSEAIPLLKNNPFIFRLMALDFLTLQQLEHEYFDTVINLEKIPGICALMKKIEAWKKYGFRLDPRTGEVKPHDKAFEALVVSSDPEAKKQNQKTHQELLFEMLGEKWKGEEPILGYKPKSQEIFDVALNTQIGAKWPTKSWPLEFWDKTEELLQKESFKVTRQDKQNPKILSDLYLYIEWVNSSKLIISNDSLGLHLGIALKKKVLGLFGPTPHKEVYFYGRGKAMLPQPIPDCLPCFEPSCKKKDTCMRDITPEKVINEVRELLTKN